MGRFFVKVSLYTLFIILMIVDFFVISDLISTLIKTDNFIALAMAFGFIAGIDIVPIFALTPALNKRMKGLTDKTGAENFLIGAAILIFIILEAAYFGLSISHPERFFIGEAVIGAERENLMLVSVITGLLPLATTSISLLFNFLLIGNEYVDKEIELCDQEISKIQKANSKLESENILLDNLSDYVGFIQNHINNYKNSITDLENESMKKEREQMMLANSKIAEQCHKEFNDFLIAGERRFKENKVFLDPRGIKSYEEWQKFIKKSRIFIESKI